MACRLTISAILISYIVKNKRCTLERLSSSMASSQRRQWHPLQYSCLENPMDGGAWWAAIHGVAKSRARLSDFTFTFHFHALEKEMATHSSVLAWRIPGTGEPSGLPSLGSRLKRLSSSSSSMASSPFKTKNLLLTSYL